MRTFYATISYMEFPMPIETIVMAITAKDYTNAFMIAASKAFSFFSGTAYYLVKLEITDAIPSETET